MSSATDPIAPDANTIQLMNGFYSVFSSENLYNSGIQLQKSNNIGEVNKLLDKLFHKNVDLEAKSQFFGGNSKQPPLASYNARTPYVRILINGLQFVPNYNTWTTEQQEASDRKSANDKTADGYILRTIEVEFQNLELSMPFGGVGSTIVGTLTLFSRDPVELVSFINDYSVMVDPDNTDPCLPLVEIVMGWSLAQETGQGSFLLSPEMEFLVMGISMTDPGRGQGAEITLKLQDKGSAVLKNSSSNLVIIADYPQQQLRVILEGLLGIRLFTLDDFLYLGYQNKSISLTPSFTTPHQIISQISGYIVSSGNPTGETSLEDQQYIKESYEDILTGLKNSLSLNPTTQTIFTNDTKNPNLTIKQLSEDLVDNSNGTITYSDILNAINTNRTFFVNAKNPTIRMNTDTIANVVQSLVDKIQCRWYPISNSRLADAIANPTTAQNLFDINQKLQQAKTAEDKAAAQLEVQQAIDKISTACILIWCPIFPKNIKTTSGDNYGNISDDEGAYLLLPQVMTDPQLKDIQLPLIYGPGGSSAPWYYAGGQNILQTSLANNGIIPMAYGEVLDVSVKYDNLLELMRLKLNETAMYAYAGERWNALNQAKTATQNTKAQLEQKKARLLEQAPNLLKDYQQYISGKKSKCKFYRVKSRAFTRTFAPRTVTHGDRITTQNTNNPDNRSHFNPSDVKQYTEDRLATRATLFLGYPTTIGMSILGDPFLLRQGIGAFELINYYPDKTGELMKLNFLTSGIYMPTNITHSISTGEYITKINALKVPYPVPGSIIRELTMPILNANSSSSGDIIAAEQKLLGTATLNLETQLLNLPSISTSTTNVNTNTSESFTTTQTAASTNFNQTAFLSNTVPADMGASFTNAIKDIYTQANLINDTTKNAALTAFMASMQKQAKNNK